MAITVLLRLLTRAAHASVLAMAFAAAGASLAQTTPLRLGYLTPAAQEEREAAFFDELAKLGYRRDANLAVEYRSADGDFGRLPALAADLVAAKVDVIVAVVTQAAVAAKRATATSPIVIVAVADPVGSGVVAALARPGGNVTGNSAPTAELLGKQIELLREVRPGLARLAVLSNPTNRTYQQQQLGEIRAVGRRLGLPIDLFEASTPPAFGAAFAAMRASGAQAVLVVPDPLYNEHAATLARLATANGLASASGTALYTAAGFLVSYGVDFTALHRGAAHYVDRIAKGAKPAGLPIERPVRYELVVNAATARALGVALAPSLLARADVVIR